MFLDNYLPNSPLFTSCVPIHHHCLAQNGLISHWATLNMTVSYLPTLTVAQMNFDVPTCSILKTMLLSDA